MAKTSFEWADGILVALCSPGNDSGSFAAMTKEIRKHGAGAWVRTLCVVDEIDTFLARHHDIAQAARGRHLRLAVVTDSSAVTGCLWPSLARPGRYPVLCPAQLG